MSISALMEEMAAKGASLDVILMAVRAVEAEQQKLADARAKVAARKRKQRDNERDCHATVTGQSCDMDATTPAPSPSFSPDPSTNPTHTPEGITPARKATAWPVPEGVDAEHWRDLLTNRKSKRLPNTPTAHRRLLADLASLSDDEWPPGRIVQHAAERGWGAIFDPRERRNGNGSQQRGSRQGSWLDA